EKSNLGTLFLDEIGKMAIELQTELLRVLKTGTFHKRRETSLTNDDVRIIAATNRNLERQAKYSHLSSYLYYRLSVFTITLPSLKERTSDIPLLVKHFVALQAAKLNMSVPKIDDSYIDLLQKHSWKGNVRELKNSIERSLILIEG